MTTVIQLFTLFVNRSDDYLIQLPEDRGYSRVDAPLTPADLAKHLSFEKTVTVYQLDKNASVKWLCFDVDGEMSLERARILQELLEKDLFKNATLLEDTGGRGHHVWCFLKHKISAKVARNFCAHLLSRVDMECEYYPKQDTLSQAKPFGSAVRLPCGLHTKYQEPSRLLNPTTLNDIKPAIFPEDLIDEYMTYDPEPESNGLKEKQVVRQVGVVRVSYNLKEESTENRCGAVRALMKGVDEGVRDVAAFALARFYVDRRLVRSEIDILLSIWNNLNKPPLVTSQLKKCIRSACSKGKKYRFGCGTFKDPLIKKYCEQNKDTCGIRMQRSKKTGPPQRIIGELF